MSKQTDAFSMFFKIILVGFAEKMYLCTAFLLSTLRVMVN